MSSKRMAISALLSSNATAPTQPPSPAPSSTSHEPPLKRQRQHQDHGPQYYDSYHAYPNASSSSMPRFHPPPQPHQQSQSPRSASPSAPPQQTWPPVHTHTPSRPHSDHRVQWDKGPHYVPASSVATSGAFDFVRPHSQTSNLRGAADDDAVDVRRDARFQPFSTGKGQSIADVLSDQMRAPQSRTALPVPPQLRRDAQHSHPSYAVPAVLGSISPAPVTYRHPSPLAVKVSIPHTTPPSLSPLSSYSSHQISPTPSYGTQIASPIARPPPNPSLRENVSPTTYISPKNSPTIYTSPKVSPTTYASPKISPTATYPPSLVSPGTQSAITVSPIVPRASQLSRASPSTSYEPSGRYPMAPHVSDPPKHVPDSREPIRISEPEPERERSPRPPASPILHQTLAYPAERSNSQPPRTRMPSLQLPPSLTAEADDDRSFEDELLSLVDGEDIKSKLVRPLTQLPPAETSSTDNGHPSTTSSKPIAKPKPPPKPRAPAKPPKSKAAPKHTSTSGTPVPTSSMPPPSPLPAKQQPGAPRTKGRVTKKKVTNASTARARSLSVKPAEMTPTPDAEAGPEEDRLYCMCLTPYDEDKVMIACDRCDEWYHPACVGMSEVEVDLVDQYICGSCAKQKAGLQTTYKQRCHRGLEYLNSHDDLPACWKPARGAFSKYCSDECGVAHVRAKMMQSGRDAANIWPEVKNARRRQGVTITQGQTEDSPGNVNKDLERKKAALMEARKALKDADKRELADLMARLDEVMNAREACKAALERVITRRRLLDLAVERATARSCGWDVRLEMNDEEWSDWAATEGGFRALDGREGEDEEQWWCHGPEKCPRHNGWQNIRDLDVQAEVDSKNSTIKQLTDRERELRRRIEDIDPPSVPVKQRPGGKKKNQGKKSTR